MELFFTCPLCRKRLKVRGSTMGTQVGCPACQKPVTVPRGDFAPGTRIGGFEVVRPLGKGGMGEVYLARQLAMGREVALKVLSAEFAAKPEARERFLKEVRVAAKLEHPHIVTAHDAGEDDGLCYMAMSFVPAESLAARLKPGAVMGEREALAMTRKLAQALDYAWSRFHLIHRDIKPANILFDADGEPKLADMGLSKSLDDAEAMTMSGAVMGTPNYMSPEQAEGASDLDLRADIYSLGATLYHALTGQMPFAGSSIMAVLRRQAVEILPDPREFNAGLSEHCVGLLQIMLAKKREDRYADWKALIRDIDFVLDAKPPSLALPGEGKSVLIRRGAGHAPHRKIVIPKGGLHHEKPAPVPAPPPARKAMKPRDKALIFGGVAALAVAALAIGLVLHLSKQRGEERRLQAEREARQAAETRERESRAAAEKTQAEIWQVAVDYAAAHPAEFDRAVSNFEDAGKRLTGTKYELMARNEIDRLRTARKAAIERAFGELEARAGALADRKDFNGAAEVFAKYGGPFAADLAERRAAAEQGHREAALAALEKLSQADREAKQREEVVIAAAAEAVWAGDPGPAQQACKAFLDDPAVTIDKSTVRRIAGWLEAAAGADRELLATFEAQKGKGIVLSSGAAKVPVRVLGVRGDRIQIEQKKGVGWASAELALAQVPFEERQARMAGKLDPAALGLWNGMACLRARRPDLAAEAFKATGELATLLLAKAEGAKSGEREAAAGAAFAQALRAAGLPAEGVEPARLAERLAPGKVSSAQAAAALRQLDAYAAAFGDTQHAKSITDTLATLRPALEAAQKGIAAPAPAAAAPKIDDFAKRVLAARAYTGEVVRCSPEGREGIPSLADVAKRLKRGTVLRICPGKFADPVIIDTPHLTIESEGPVEGTVFLQSDGCTLRKMQGLKLIVQCRIPSGSRTLVVDSCLQQIDSAAEGELEVFNSALCVLKAARKSVNRLRHCTLLKGGYRGLIESAWDCRLVRLEDSLAAIPDRNPLNIRIVNETDKPAVAFEIERSVLYSKIGLGCQRQGDPNKSTYVPFEETGDLRRVRMTQCVTNEVWVRYFGGDSGRPYVLVSDSPGKGIAAGGRDPGALLDDQGNILPLDPVPPAASASIAPGVAPARLDDFAKRVLAARAYTGEVIRCSPKGGEGILSVKEAVTKLKRGMILHLLPGTYDDEALSVSADDIVVEAEPTGVHGAIRLHMRSGTVRSLSGIGLILGASDQVGEQYTIVDCKLSNAGLWARDIRCFNTWIMNAYISGHGDVELRHCTLYRGTQKGAAQLLFGYVVENIRISDSVLWDMEKPILAMLDGKSQTRLRVERCLVGNPSASPVGKPPRPSTDLSAFPSASMKDCVIETPLFVGPKVARLTSTSPGRGIAAGGRDPGALLDDQGNILPLDPVAPAAGSARIGVQAQPGVAASQAAPSPSGGGGTWISLDLHPGFNADFISTATRVAADSFSVTAPSNSTWGTTNYARRHLGVEGPGLPDDGRVAIARDPPGGYFELETVANANAILITAPEGRQPKPVRIELPIVQQQRCAKIAVLHGGAWGDGEVILTVEYGGGAPSHHVLAIRDWKPKGPRLPLPTNAWSAAQVLGSSGRAEMFGQVCELDTTRVIRALRFDFDAYHPPKDYASTSRHYGAAVFAVSALPAAPP